MCLGRNPRECDILTWIKYPSDPKFSQVFKIPDGIPAWLRLRVSNNVELHTIGRADQAIIVDSSPPLGGIVYDGEIFREDLRYTKYDTKICANWFGFFDPESGISTYEVGVGSEPGFTDVASLKKLRHHEHEYCVYLDENSTLIHNEEYYVVVWANNAAINQRNVSGISNGVRVDLTKPVQGEAVDGNLDKFKDLQYSSSKTTVQLQWRNFFDPESGIRQYDVQVERKRYGFDWQVIKDWTTYDRNTTNAEWRNFHLEHKDEIKSILKATNEALNDVSAGTSGFLVDLTPPLLERLSDGKEDDIEYQSDTSKVEVTFSFIDLESGVDHLKMQVHEQHQGMRRQFYPETSSTWEEIKDGNLTYYKITGLQLNVGYKYFSRLVATNGAGLISTFETNGFIVDNTPPQIHWIRVGVLSGIEETIDGYVWQSDHQGIKASWSASDTQSGIVSLQYAVGTSPGTGDILAWTLKDVFITNAYLPCTLLDTDIDGSNQPVYYVSVKVSNGAGLWSESISSTPIVVVPEDVTGNVIDGSSKSLDNDVDYQSETHTLTMTFSGFESSLRGIMKYDWAIGISPGGEDIQPFIEHGIIHYEEELVAGNGITSSGHAQVALDLDSGTSYYTTLRAITNAGNILQATTNGFVVDTTRPRLNFTRVADIENEPDRVIYQKDESVLVASWKYSDMNLLNEENIDNIYTTWYMVGSFPYSDDIFAQTYGNATSSGEGFLPTGQVKPALAGIPNIVTVGIENKAGLLETQASVSVVQDNTAPVAGQVHCSKFIQSHHPVECNWTGFVDAQSGIEKYYIFFGSKPGFDNIKKAEAFSSEISSFSAKDIDKDHADVIYATVTAVNKIGLTVNAQSESIKVDDTPPKPGVVIEIPSISRVDPNNIDKTVEMNKRACTTKEECLQIDANCTENLARITIAWAEFSDLESELSGFELALGSTAGGTQIVEFFKIPAVLNHYTITSIDLLGYRQVFATLKAFNGAGHSTTVTSSGVFLSYLSQNLPPLEHVGVYDSHQHSFGDIDFQSDTTSIEAKWDVSGDPCPAVKYEWSIEQTDGVVLQTFVDMYTSTHGISDQLDLKEGRRYYNLVRITNMMGYVYTLRSNGVTINSNTMLPGMVYDGDVTGYDLKALSSRTLVSANWEGFGEIRQNINVADVLTGNSGIEKETEQDPNQQVAYYEVALGTDRRFEKSRDNVVPFTNVGLNTSVTFKDLDLVPGYAVYYFTVKAYSASYSYAITTSNGFYVSFDGGVTAGKINMPDYVSSNTILEVQWEGFSSKVGIMLYYVALSDNYTLASADCRRYVDGGKATDEEKVATFNTLGVASVGSSTYKILQGLSLLQNGSYYIFLMGVDMAGECNMAYHHFTVDITKPFPGRITGGPYFDMSLAYTRVDSTVSVKWDGFQDEESGIDTFNLTFWQRGQCSASTSQGVALKTVQVFGNYSDYIFTNLTIKKATVYVVSIQAINKAGLVTSATTSPIVYDNSVPSAGHVSEGSVFTADVVWWGYTDHVNGTLLHYPLQVSHPCPSRNISLLDKSWTVLQRRNLNDPDGLAWKLEHREANIHRDTYEDAITIKIARDSKAARVYSAAYMRKADLKDGGTYEISIKAADGNGKAVTGVTFWDGEENDLHLYNHQPMNWQEGSCSCCLEANVSVCACNCTEYLEKANQTLDSADLNDTTIDINRTDTNNYPTAQQSCGLQTFTDEHPYIVTWCRFFNNSGELMSVKSEIDFDPSDDFHRYKVVFVWIKEDMSVTSCIQASVDGKQVSEMCGIPLLSVSTKLVLHVWHKDNIVPTLNVFDLWNAKATFKQLVMPPDVKELCRYGEPFEGGNNAIVGYEAAIGTTLQGSDVVQFQRVRKPCVPCSDACSKFDCQPSCPSTGYSLVHFSITNIQLNSSYDGAYYITVRALLGSGAEAVSSSNGFYIDTTPPVFDETVMMYIDVRQGEFTPSDFQGSNNTIKALWLCNDDRSEIQKYEWAIGTYVGGTDIQSFVSTGEFSTGINSNLDGILKHNTTYYISIKCTNEAGLTTFWIDKKGVTVLLEAPDADSVSAEAVGAKHFDHEVYPPSAVESADPTSCGESWTLSTDPNVRRYDFCVGSNKDTIDDIVPCVWVGYNTSGVVEIKNGSLWIDGVAFRKISELRVLSKGMYDFETEDTNDNTFRMETGRTLFLFMKLCNKAEICIVKFVNTLLITNDKAELATSKNGEAIATTVGSKQRKRRSTLDIVVESPETLEKGQSLLINELSAADLTVSYESTASSVFNPFIVNPATTANQTERLLYRRIRTFERIFTISSIGQLPLPGPLEISFPQSNFNASGDDNMTMLIHWNPDVGEWQISSKTCKTYNSTIEDNYEDGTTTVKICNTKRSSNDLSSKNETYFFAETQFAMSIVSAEIVNSPPELIKPTYISLEEDSDDLKIPVIAVDKENDPILFNATSLNSNQVFGKVSLDSAGILTIYPCRNCYGAGTISLILQDVPLWEDIIPAHSEYFITIEVIPVNDPPNIDLIANNGKSMLLSDPTEEILIFREQSELPFTLTLGTLVAFDIDGPQHLEIISISNNSSGTFNLTDMEIDSVFELVSCNSSTKCDYFDSNVQTTQVAWKGVRITYSQMNESFVGIDRIKLVAKDSNETFSDVITVTVVIMENKCVHGSCKSLNPRQYSCNDTRRTVSFDQFYTCDCPVSWQGQYCEHDADECSIGLCEAWKICENTIGSFNCYCKSSDIICKLSLKEWEFAIIVVAIVSVIAVVIGIFIFRKYKANKAKAMGKKFGSGEDTFTSFKETLGPSKLVLKLRSATVVPQEEIDEEQDEDGSERMNHDPEQHNLMNFFERTEPGPSKPHLRLFSKKVHPLPQNELEEDGDLTFIHPEPNWNQNVSLDAAQLQEAFAHHGILEDSSAPPMSIFTERKKTTREIPKHPHSKSAAMKLQPITREKNKRADDHGDIEDIALDTTQFALTNDAEPENSDTSDPVESNTNKENDLNAYQDNDTDIIFTNESEPFAVGNEDEDGRYSRQSALTMKNEEMAEVEC